ncbi:MAG: hypothetical protein ACKO5E_22780 [bacterium]
MKRLHVSLFNQTPLGRKTLIDLLDWVEAGFTENGFKVTISDEDFIAGVPNLIFENNHRQQAFFDKFGPNGKPFPLIIFVTEVIHKNKFDDWSGNWNGNERFRDFLPMMQIADGFLTTVPGNVKPLRKVAPASFFEFGYSEKLVSAVPPDQWQYDYSFAGALTPHRTKFLNEITARGLHVTSPAKGPVDADHTAAVSTNDLYLDSIRHSAINICLKQHPDWPLPSGTRLARIAHSITGCALEQTATVTKQSALFPTFTGVDDFLNRFGTIDRQKIHREAVDRLNLYRETLPLKAEVARNIDEVPALTPKIPKFKKL